MDFAIEIDGVKIAIEVEGWDKTGENRGKNKTEHDEFNRRIQSLESQGWRVLTVTNAQFMADPAHYANLIRQLILQGPKTPQSDSSSTTEKVEEVEEPKEPEQTPNEERKVKPLYALVGLAAIVVIGVVIWSMTRDSNTLVILDRIEETDRQDSAPDSANGAEDASTPEYLSAEEFQEMYILKDGGNVHSLIDFQAVKDEVNCLTLGDDQKPVFLPDPEKDFFNLDSVGIGDGWGCTKGFPVPIYYTKNFERNGNTWFFEFTKEDGDMDCEHVPVEAKPIYLSDAENDPYLLDEWGVGDGVGCKDQK